MRHKWISVLVSLAIALSVWGLMPSSVVMADGPNVVISQVYGGGGNAGATYLNDYVELYNRGTTTVSLSGWSIQYASATGIGNFLANPIAMLSGSIAPGRYYLVQLASGGVNGAALPTPDATGTVNMAVAAGKVILANTTTGLTCNGGSTPCDAGQLAQIIDLVGYGTTANFCEGSPQNACTTAAPAPSATLADLRSGTGCRDTDNNSADFTAGAPAPRNTSSPTSFCTCNSQSSGNWSNPAIWSCGNPASTALVIIQNSHFVALDTNANVSDLDVNAGGALVSNGNSIAASGILTNNGTLTQTLPVDGSSNVGFFNTGNYGGVILNANNLDLGSTTVAIKGNQNCDTNNTSVRRCFNITPATTTGRDATITFSFSASELGTQTCNTSLQVWRWTGSAWTLAGTSAAPDCVGTPNSIQVTGVSSFSPFALSNGIAGPTAVTLRSFSANNSLLPAGAVFAALSMVVLVGLIIYLRRQSRAA
jgi:hypothetical protein